MSKNKIAKSLGVCIRNVLAYFLVLAGGALAQDDQWLQYRWSREARRIMPDIGSRGVELETSAPNDVELPQFADEQQFFGRWKTPMAGQGYVQIALDRDSKYGKHNVVYVDSDCDGSLADEQAVKAYNVEQYGSDFGPVRIIFEGEDGPVTYHISLEYRSYDDKRHYLQVYSAGWYEGLIEVDGVKKYCALIDHNANGVFNNKSSNFSGSDRIIIGDTKDSASTFVGNYIEIGNKLYRPKIAKDGAYIKLTKAKNVVFGKVQVSENITELAVGGKNGLFKVDLQAGQGQVPVGRYRVHHWAIEREDNEGKKWRLEGTGFNSKTRFDVNEQQEAVLEIGEPVVCTFKYSNRGRRNYLFEQELEGRMGEKIELKREGEEPRAPRLAVKNRDGAYAKTYNFEYG